MENKILDIINEANSIVLLTHETPDGDAIGSIMSFYYMLNSINKSVDVVSSKISKCFNYIKDISKIVDTTDKKYDLAIIFDCSSKERIGQTNDIFINCAKSICIDHHANNTCYCDINYIDGNCSSCCQMIYYLFNKWKIDISHDIGEAIITGVLTDTGGLYNDNVDKETFLLVANIYDKGINIHNIYYNVLHKKTLAQQELMKFTIDRIELFDDGKIAFSYITKEDIDRAEASYGDHEGLVEFGRNIEGVEVSIFVREDDDYRVSLRSNGLIDVREIALFFNGGGHKMAAGCKISLPFKETKTTLINETKRIIDSQ